MSPPAKCRRLDLEDEVVVIVGKSKAKFSVPKCFLTKSSDFFKACCNGEWKEAQSRTITLPEADVEAFKVYLQWLYTNELVAYDEDTSLNISSLPEDERIAAGQSRTKLLYKLAMLADHHGDAMCANMTVDSLISVYVVFNMLPSNHTICRIYENLPASSGLRKLVIGMAADYFQPIHFLEKKAELPTDFIFDVMMKLKESSIAAVKKIDTLLEDRCKYHEHGDGAPRCQ